MPSFRSASSVTGSAGSVTIPAPNGLLNGDLLVASIEVSHGSSLTPPSGWTLADSIDGGAGANVVSVYTRTAGPSEPVSYAWTASGSPALIQGTIVDYYGQALIPLDVHGNATGTGTSMSAPAETVKGKDTVILVYSASTGQSNIGLPQWSSNFATFRVLLNTTVAPLVVAEYQVVSPGNIGPFISTLTSSGIWTAQAVAFLSSPVPYAINLSVTVPLTTAYAIRFAQGTTPPITWTFEDTNGNPLNLNGKTIKLTVYTDNGAVQTTVFTHDTTSGLSVTNNSSVTWFPVAGDVANAQVLRYLLTDQTDIIELVRGALSIYAV